MARANKSPDAAASGATVLQFPPSRKEPTAARPPVEVRDADGVLVARITSKPYKAPKPRKTTARRVLEIVALLALWKLVAWLLVLSLAAREGRAHG